MALVASGQKNVCIIWRNTLLQKKLEDEIVMLKDDKDSYLIFDKDSQVKLKSDKAMKEINLEATRPEDASGERKFTKEG